jgi:hypothetical protein
MPVKFRDRESRVIACSSMLCNLTFWKLFLYSANYCYEHCLAVVLRVDVINREQICNEVDIQEIQNGVLVL